MGHLDAKSRKQPCYIYVRLPFYNVVIVLDFNMIHNFSRKKPMNLFSKIFIIYFRRTAGIPPVCAPM
jgi:hypothetical protein